MKLNAEQRAAVEHNGGDVLVLAGAGTGKTTTIVNRAVHLMRSGASAARIAMLTFTRRAAKEMKARLHSMVGESARLVAAGTFHHFCLRTIRQRPVIFGWKESTVIDRDDQLQMMKLARARFVKKGEVFPKADELVGIYSFARNTDRPIREHIEKYQDIEADQVDRLLEVFAEYERRKQECRYLDFDDILLLFADALCNNAECRAWVASLYDEVLVDEMQDTNPLQWRILDAMRSPARLYCVGDDAQSIYGWRGADFKNIHSFTDRVPGGQILKLTENYRSTQETLDLSNWLLTRSPLRYDKKLVAARGKGEHPYLLDFDSEYDEAEWLTDDLLDRHEDGVDWRDHMVLIRTAHSARALEAAMIRKEIPYRFIGGTSLLRSAHVKDLLSMLRTVLNHRDELAWMRYLTLWPKIGDKTASKIIQELKTLPSVEAAIERVAELLPKRADVVDPLRAVLGCRDVPTKAIAAAAAWLSPVLEKRYEQWDRRKRDFDLLRQLAGYHKSLPSFIETYTLDPISESQANKPEVDDCITLITVHSAKGTEAPVCYVLRAEAGMYPHVRSLGDFDDEEEDRRVLYVAMTRAQDELILTRTNRRDDWLVLHGGREAKHSKEGEGYFLAEVPGELVCTDASEFDLCLGEA